MIDSFVDFFLVEDLRVTIATNLAASNEVCENVEKLFNRLNIRLAATNDRLAQPYRIRNGTIKITQLRPQSIVRINF